MNIFMKICMNIFMTIFVPFCAPMSGIAVIRMATESSPHLATFANGATGGRVNMHFGEDIPQPRNLRMKKEPWRIQTCAVCMYVCMYVYIYIREGTKVLRCRHV